MKCQTSSRLKCKAQLDSLLRGEPAGIDVHFIDMLGVLLQHSVSAERPILTYLLSMALLEATKLDAEQALKLSEFL